MLSSSAHAQGLFRDESDGDFWLRLRIPVAAAALFYCVFASLVYWPVFAGLRFFWEDFHSWEYPVRDYCYYMFGMQHSLPFWNPYNWNLPAVLADGQNGFWYPTNILAIVITRIIAPGLSHLPVLVPEVLTIAHLPLAALGVFYLLRKHFHVLDAVALIAGLTYGFGSRIVADQNHPMFVYQLALLPWATLLLLRSWSSWRSTAGLGLILGVSFFAGQPQVFLFTCFFFLCFTLAEAFIRTRERGFTHNAFRPVASLGIAMALACGIAAIQLLPSLELAGMSARARLTYSEASRYALDRGGLIGFLVPKMFPEAGDTLSHGPMQPTFYWSALAEIFAVFAVIALWTHRRDRNDARTRHLLFVVGFCLFAILFAFGSTLPVQWMFWKFVPLFDKVRAPARMLWIFWLLGTIYGGIGLDLFLTHRDTVARYRKFFIAAAIVLVLVNIVAATGVLDWIFLHAHQMRPGLLLQLLPLLIMSMLVAAFLLLSARGKIRFNLLLPIAGALILVDLFYNDATQHRNTISRDAITKEDAANPALQTFFEYHPRDHAKLLWRRNGTAYGTRENLGMILRLNIEEASDSAQLLDINPMHLTRSFPPVVDSVRRMEIMGVAGMVSEGSDANGRADSLVTLPNALPFLKLYHEWLTVPSDSAAARLYSDSSFDFQRTLIVSDTGINSNPGFSRKAETIEAKTVLSHFSENEFGVVVQTSRPAVLLINDLYYPAWKATVDGQDTRILRAFTSLRAIPLKVGTHSVELRYDDVAFNWGWKISAASLAMVLALLIWPKRRNRPDELAARI